MSVEDRVKTFYKPKIKYKEVKKNKTLAKAIEGKPIFEEEEPGEIENG